MCRLGLVSLQSKADVTKLVNYAQIFYSRMNSDGTGYGYANKGNKKVKVVKSGDPAVNFWFKNNKKIIGETCIWHVRAATHGKNTDANAHPFLNETGNIALVHNGVLYDYDKLKEELISKGHVFTSETDSEVMLHAYEEWGMNFIKKVKGRISGQATLLIIDFKSGKPRIIAYTNSDSLNLYKTKDGIFGFSDDCFNFGGRKLKIGDDRLYTIVDGKIIDRKKVPSLYKWSYGFKREETNEVRITHRSVPDYQIEETLEGIKVWEEEYWRGQYVSPLEKWREDLNELEKKRMMKRFKKHKNLEENLESELYSNN